MSRISRFLRRKKNQDEPRRDYCSIEFSEPRDVFIAGYPKSGNTWMQLLVAALQFNLKPETTPDTLVHELIPDVHKKRYYKRFLETTAFKTHHLPKENYRRVISIVRDGRDALCSYKHFNDALGDTHTLDEMIDSGAGLYPCQWHQYIEAWESNPFGAERIIVRYEDLKQDCIAQLRRVADFLAIDVSKERLSELADGTEVTKMQKREATLGWNFKAWPKDKKFVRKGIAGSFRSEMSPAQIQRFEEHAGAALKMLGYATSGFQAAQATGQSFAATHDAA